jgi:hypothetical protein
MDGANNPGLQAAMVLLFAPATGSLGSSYDPLKHSRPASELSRPICVASAVSTHRFPMPRLRRR